MTVPVPLPRRRPWTAVLRVPVAAVALGLFSAAMWYAWLGWDHKYYLVDGVAQGPYRPWQVVGCAVAVAAASVLAHLWSRHRLGLLLLPAAGTIGFAVPWSVDASADETGMWVVGLIMLLVGGGLALLVVVELAEVVRRARAR